MQDALPIVIVAVVGIAAVVAVLTLARGKGVYDDIRAGDVRPGADPAHVREAEIAQMQAALEARRQARCPIEPDDTARPARSGGGVPIDDDLRAEVRALVQARNARRIARGDPPLDVDSEVERRIAELDG
jgi:hypothetical protein